MRSINFLHGVSFFGIISSKEEPSMRISTSGVGNVVVESRHFKLKIDIHSTVFANSDKGKRTFKVPFHLIYSHILLWIRNRKTCTCNYIFGIFGDERRRVVPCTVRDLNDLFGFKSFKTNTCYPWRVIFVDKYPTPIKFSFSLRNIWMVRISPRHKSERSI